MVCGCWIIASTAWLWQPALFWHVRKCVQTKEALSREVARTRLHLLVKADFGITFLSFGISCHAQNWFHNGQPVSLKRNLQIDWLSTWMSHCQAISILKKKKKKTCLTYSDMITVNLHRWFQIKVFFHEGFMIFWDYWIDTTAICVHEDPCCHTNSIYVNVCMSTNFGFTNTVQTQQHSLKTTTEEKTSITLLIKHHATLKTDHSNILQHGVKIK